MSEQEMGPDHPLDDIENEFKERTEKAEYQIVKMLVHDNLVGFSTSTAMDLISRFSKDAVSQAIWSEITELRELKTGLEQHIGFCERCDSAGFPLNEKQQEELVEFRSGLLAIEDLLTKLEATYGEVTSD